MKLINYFKDSINEFKKLTFPSRKETYIATTTIVVTIAIFSLAILLTDFIISKIIGLIFGIN